MRGCSTTPRLNDPPIKEDMTMAKTMSISLVVTFALLVAACGGSAPPPGAGTGSPAVPQTAGTTTAKTSAAGTSVAGTRAALDVCALLTDAEVETETGLQVVSSDPEPNGIECLWTLEEGNRFWVVLRVDWPVARDDFDFCAIDAAPVSGLGDEAAQKVLTDTYALCVLRGDDYLRLGASDQMWRAGEDSRFHELARLVLERV